LCDFKTCNQIIMSIHHITLCIWFRKREKLNNFLFFKKPFFNFLDKKKPPQPLWYVGGIKNELPEKNY